MEKPENLELATAENSELAQIENAKNQEVQTKLPTTQDMLGLFGQCFHDFIIGFALEFKLIDPQKGIVVHRVLPEFAFILNKDYNDFIDYIVEHLMKDETLELSTKVEIQEKADMCKGIFIKGFVTGLLSRLYAKKISKEREKELLKIANTDTFIKFVPHLSNAVLALKFAFAMPNKDYSPYVSQLFQSAISPNDIHNITNIMNGN